jgi:hypothetical protein
MESKNIIPTKSIIDYVNRAPYYFDLFLFWRILKTSFCVFSSKEQNFLSIIKVDISNPIHHANREKMITKISHYVSIFLRIRLLLKKPHTCLTHSIIYCRVLRDYGIDAKVNFGTKKELNPETMEWPLTGHCWVTYDDEFIDSEYSFTFQIP